MLVLSTYIYIIYINKTVSFTKLKIMVNFLWSKFFSEFIRKKLPFNILKRIESEKNINVFLSGWIDNKVRALIFEPRRQIRLRYLLTAFEFYDRVTFG